MEFLLYPLEKCCISTTRCELGIGVHSIIDVIPVYSLIIKKKKKTILYLELYRHLRQKIKRLYIHAHVLNFLFCHVFKFFISLSNQCVGKFLTYFL